MGDSLNITLGLWNAVAKMEILRAQHKIPTVDNTGMSASHNKLIIRSILKHGGHHAVLPPIQCSNSRPIYRAIMPDDNICVDKFMPHPMKLFHSFITLTDM